MIQHRGCWGDRRRWYPDLQSHCEWDDWRLRRCWSPANTPDITERWRTVHHTVRRTCFNKYRTRRMRNSLSLSVCVCFTQRQLKCSDMSAAESIWEGWKYEFWVWRYAGSASHWCLNQTRTKRSYILICTKKNQDTVYWRVRTTRTDANISCKYTGVRIIRKRERSEKHTECIYSHVPQGTMWKEGGLIINSIIMECTLTHK